MAAYRVWCVELEGWFWVKNHLNHQVEWYVCIFVALEVPASWTGWGEVHLLSQLLGTYCRSTLWGSLGNNWWLPYTMHHSSWKFCTCPQIGCLEARSHQHPRDCSSSLMTFLLAECSESSTETQVPHKHGACHSVKELVASPGTGWTGIDVKAIRVRRISKGVGFSVYPNCFTNHSYHFLMFQINPWNATVCDHICVGKGGAKARPPTMKVTYTPPFHSLIPLPIPPELKPGNHNILGNEFLRGNPSSN